MAASARLALVQQVVACAQQQGVARVAYTCFEACTQRMGLGPSTSGRSPAASTSASSASFWRHALSSDLSHSSAPASAGSISEAVWGAWRSLLPPSSIWSGLVLSTHLTWQPKVRKRKREHGFLKRYVSPCPQYFQPGPDLPTAQLTCFAPVSRPRLHRVVFKSTHRA